jgi:UDP-glucuronate 4-epimerase
MAHAHINLYDLPTTGLSFSTVYRPWDRPYMAPMLFEDAIVSKGKAINVFNDGKMQRDFTYIEDIVEGVAELALQFNREEEVKTEIFNIGNSKPIKLMSFIEGLELEMGEEAVKNLMPMQDSDVKVTYADASKLEKTTGYKPETELKAGLREFVGWYKSFYMR